MGFTGFQPNCIYGHWNLHFLLFSRVVKHSSLDFFPPNLITYKPFLSLRPYEDRLQMWPISALLTLNQKGGKNENKTIWKEMWIAVFFQPFSHCVHFNLRSVHCLSLYWTRCSSSNLHVEQTVWPCAVHWTLSHSFLIIIQLLSHGVGALGIPSHNAP